MPAVSQAQRGFLYANKGAAWVKRHHFDNKGPLPDHVRRLAEHTVAQNRRKRAKAKR